MIESKGGMYLVLSLIIFDKEKSSRGGINDLSEVFALKDCKNQATRIDKSKKFAR